MIYLKQIFTWWHRQTLGTFLKTMFSGKLVGKDSMGNKYYTNNKDERWIVYSNNIESTKINSDWFLWMHHTINDIPSKNPKKKYLWQKNHSENLTGTTNSYKPNKISKNQNLKKYDTWKN